MDRTPRQHAERIIGVTLALWEAATIATGGHTISRTLRRHRALAIITTIWWIHHIGLTARGAPTNIPAPLS